MDIGEVGPLPGGMHPSQKKGYDVSALLTLFDLRICVADMEPRDVKRIPSDPEIPLDVEVCVRTTRGSFAEKFITKAHGVLLDALRQHDCQLSVSLEENLLIASLLNKEGSALTESSCRTIICTLEESLQTKDDPFHWSELCINLVEESKKVLCSLNESTEGEPEDGEWDKGVRKGLDKETIQKVTPEKIVPCGLPQMEVGFSAGGTQILYPDPLAFGEEHWELWEKFSPYAKKRGMLDYVYSAVLWLPHEVLHCVQDGALGAVGAEKAESLHNWQCEYCVCFGQMLFYATIIGENRKKGQSRTLMTPSYFMEEVLLWVEASARSHPQGAGQAWLQCKGAEVPHPEQPYLFMEDHHEEYLVLLCKVLLETFKAYQAFVEIDEQVTSYWAEFVKVCEMGGRVGGEGNLLKM